MNFLSLSLSLSLSTAESDDAYSFEERGRECACVRVCVRDSKKGGMA